MRLTLSSFAAAMILGCAPSGAANAGFAPGSAGDALDRAAPAQFEPAWHRGRPHRGRLVCAIRHRPFYNGLFWRTAPVRVCWRR
jgi:hypothetical protein